MQGMRTLTVLLGTLALGACRIVVDVEGQGAVYGGRSQEIFPDGYVFDINEDFSEIFWPLPVPGHAFERWKGLCNTMYKPCDLTLDEELWGQDLDTVLGPVYQANYQGPLDLWDFSLYWNSVSRQLSIPANTLDVRGQKAGAAPRVFIGTTDFERVIRGQLVDARYVFQLEPGDDPAQFWPFISSTDSNGIIASASITFGLDDLPLPSALHAHNANSKWASVLPQCVTGNNPFQLCNFATLPLLGATQSSPTIGAIMARTVVSKPWMGQRFNQMLQQLPVGMLKLFRGVTAVVIAEDIRPSFYSPATGAIYLDPQDLWLTQAERDSIVWDDDYRSEYGESLRFFEYWAYARGNLEAWLPSYAWPEGSTRTIDDILLPMANLLAHELTHANDAIPPAMLPLLRGWQTPLDAADAVFDDTPTVTLYNSYPLYSDTLYELGQVLYQGAELTSFLLSLTASQVGAEFASDSANDLYAYSTPFEDTAMLVEEVLTNYYFGVERFVAFIEDPGPSANECNDYKLRWGTRNRASISAVQNRARIVLAGVLDETSISPYFSQLPPARVLTPGNGLCQYLQLPDINDSTPGIYSVLRHVSARQVERVRRHAQFDEQRRVRRH